MPNSVPNRQSIEDDLLQMIDSDRSFSVQEKAEQDAIQSNSDSGSFINNHNFFNKQDNNASVFEPSGLGFAPSQTVNQSNDFNITSVDMPMQPIAKLTMNPTSACFVPKMQVSLDNSATTTSSADNSRDDISEKEPSEKKITGCSQRDNKERFHAGASKWGKYKKKEKEAKRQQKRRNVLDDSDTTSDKDSFDFPDGGWVCGQCQNYNF